MNYLRWAVFSVTLLCVCLPTIQGRGDCAEVVLVNGSASNTLSVVTFVGPAVVHSGSTVRWPVDTSWNTNFVDGTNAGAWQGVAGHDYTVVLPDGAGPVVGDASAGQTYWFWYGFAFVFCVGMAAVSAGWARRILMGGGESGGD